MICIWCGQPIDADEDGASFLFLAKRDSVFVTAAEFTDQSPHLEGHQFFCHARCFRASVPESLQYGLTLAIDGDSPPS